MNLWYQMIDSLNCEVAGRINDIPTVKEFVDRTMEEVEEIVSNLAAKFIRE